LEFFSPFPQRKKYVFPKNYPCRLQIQREKYFFFEKKNFLLAGWKSKEKIIFSIEAILIFIIS